MNINSWEYRELSISDRREYDKQNQLRFVSNAEIKEAKLELWEKLRPKF